MKLLACLGLAIVIGACSCPAQESSSPSATTANKHAPDLLAPDPHMNIHFALAADNASGSLPSDFHFATASAESVVLAPAATQRTPRTADTKLFLFNGIHLGLAVFDVEMTQRCIAARRCRELNPLMPSSHASQLSVNFALVAGVSGASYWLKKHQSALWWLPPATGAAVHTVGVATGFEHQ